MFNRYRIVKVKNSYAIEKWCIFHYRYRDLTYFDGRAFDKTASNVLGWRPADNNVVPVRCLTHDLNHALLAFRIVTNTETLRSKIKRKLKKVQQCTLTFFGRPAYPNVKPLTKAEVAVELISDSPNK